MKKISFTLLALLCLFSVFGQTRSNLENLTLNSNSYWNGSDLSGGFASGNVYYKNSYDTAYFSWSGFSYSNVKNDTTAGYVNQYAAITTAGVYGSANYTVANTYGDVRVRLTGAAAGKKALGFYVTNSTYAYLSMKNGDQFAKKFGGPTGTDPDWFRLTVKAWYSGALSTDSVDVYLADFRSADSTQDYILKTWKYVSLKKLGNVDSLTFSLNSSDVGSFGMNTPAYFCLDDLITSDGINTVAPIALNDAATVRYVDTAIVSVLANDTIASPLLPFVSVTSGPGIIGATASFDAQNRLVYIPALGIVSTDTVVYTLCDEADSCVTASVVFNVRGVTNTGIEELETLSLSVYPNPAQANVRVSAQDNISSLTVVDISGRAMLTSAPETSSVDMDIASWSAGVYTVIVRTAAGVSAKRLIKD